VSKQKPNKEEGSGEGARNGNLSIRLDARNGNLCIRLDARNGNLSIRLQSVCDRAAVLEAIILSLRPTSRNRLS
jgi:hypothetical protein